MSIIPNDANVISNQLEGVRFTGGTLLTQEPAARALAQRAAKIMGEFDISKALSARMNEQDTAAGDKKGSKRVSLDRAVKSEITLPVAAGPMQIVKTATVAQPADARQSPTTPSKKDRGFDIN